MIGRNAREVLALQPVSLLACVHRGPWSRLQRGDVLCCDCVMVQGIGRAWSSAGALDLNRPAGASDHALQICRRLGFLCKRLMQACMDASMHAWILLEARR